MEHQLDGVTVGVDVLIVMQKEAGCAALHMYDAALWAFHQYPRALQAGMPRAPYRDDPQIHNGRHGRQVALPGCVALGDTPEQTLTQMREAIQGHLTVMRERGEAAPEPATVIATTIEAA
jgi:predicted RNase H-like HicB family nuclease